LRTRTFAGIDINKLAAGLQELNLIEFAQMKSIDGKGRVPPGTVQFNHEHAEHKIPDRNLDPLILCR